MEKDWKLQGESLLKLLPNLVKVSFAGAELALALKQELRTDPTPLQTIMSAYLKLLTEAKERRKHACEPWPVIIIDEANRLSSWKDKEALEQLLAFFVYLSKQEQLAHGEPAELTARLAHASPTRNGSGAGHQ